MQAAGGNTNPLHDETTPHISKPTSITMFQNQNQSSNDTTNKHYDGHSRFRIGQYVSQLPFYIFPSTETGRITKTNFQLKTVKQVRKNKTISIIQPLSGSQFSPKHGLDGKIRSKPSIFSSPHRTRASLFPENELQRQTITNDMLAVWTLVSASDLRITDELDSRVSEGSQYQVCGISGRFSSSRPVSPSTPGSRGICGKTDATAWLDNQFKEICAGSDSTPGISGYHLGHRVQHALTVGTEVPNAPQGTSAPDVQRQLVPQTGPVPTGETQLCHLRDSERTPALSNTAILQSTAVQVSSIPAGQVTGRCYCRDEVVAGCDDRVPADTRSSNKSPSYYGRLRYRLGRAAGRIKDSRYVDRPTTVVAREHEGAVCSLCVDLSRTTSTSQCAHITANGQSHSRCLHQQGRWDQVQTTIDTNQKSINPIGQAECSSDGTVLPGQIQCRSRRSISAENLSRMAPYESCDRNNFPNVGNSGSGPIRFQHSTRCREVCIKGQAGRSSPISQRILPPMGLQASVVVPTTEPNTSGTVSLELCPRPLHPDSPEMAQSVLDGRSSAPNSPPALPNPELAGSSDRHTDRYASTGNTGHSFRSMADFGWSEVIQDWTESEKLLLLSSWRKSTVNTYTPIWNKWKRWCTSNSVSFKNPNPTEVARYLAHLHNDEGLAYRTILVNKSVISTFTNISSNINLSSNFFIKHILKAISVAKEKKNKPPTWDPKLVIHYLSTNSPNENNLYQVSRRVAVLLLLSSGRRVHDLTLLRTDSEKFIDEGEFIILWPSFGSKTDTVNHRQSGWKIKKHPDHNLNCVYWLRRLLIMSQDRREQGTLSTLFITARGDPKAASRTVIGGWVKAVLREAGLEASPGSTRSAVASLNWLENFPVDQILATGNWKQEHTFRRYYQKEIHQETSSRDPVSLSRYFEPVN